MRWSTSFGQVGTDCPLYGQTLRELRRTALTGLGVLLLGESGTGKELLARAVHDASERSGAFVAVNCAAIPEPLVASVLFGHVRGAFSGATHDHPGELLASSGGTLFLDEIGDAPLSVQAALLRALEVQRVKPVGGTREREVDLRIVAATSRPLHVMLTDGTFRQDLYYRLSGHEVQLPSLAARPTDIAGLVEELLRSLGHEAGALPCALAALRQRPLPGNVRQLRHLLERALVRVPAGLPLSAEYLLESAPLAPLPLGTSPTDLAVSGTPLLDGRALLQGVAPPVRQQAADWLATQERPRFRSSSRRGQRIEEQTWLLTLLAENKRCELPEPISRRVGRVFHPAWHISEGGVFPKRLAKTLRLRDARALVQTVEELVHR